MRVLLAAAAALCLTLQPSLAAECRSGSSDILTLDSWTVSPDNSRSIAGSKVEFALRSQATKAIRLVDASLHFQDVLGASISSVGVDRDLHIDAGGTASDGGTYLGTNLDRIPNMNAADVVAYVCTKAVVYDDGTSEQF